MFEKTILLPCSAASFLVSTPSTLKVNSLLSGRQNLFNGYMASVFAAGRLLGAFICGIRALCDMPLEECLMRIPY
jgi:hypothetical protein